MNLLDLLSVPLERRSRHLAIAVRTGPGTVERWSHGRLAATSAALAGSLAKRVGRGDRVALYLGNGVPTVAVLLALLRLGTVVVPMNLAYRRTEVAHVLADAEPRLLVTEAEHRERLEEWIAAAPGSVEAVLDAAELLAEAKLLADAEPSTGAGPSTGTERPSAAQPTTAEPSAAAGSGSHQAAGAADREGFTQPPGTAAPPVDGSELALLLYTSGTTGRSKGAMLSHDNLLATVTGLLAAWGWRDDDRLLLALPLFHTHGLVVGLLSALAAGAAVLLERRFDAAAVARRLLSREDDEALPRPTLFFGVPTMYVRLVDELRSLRAAGVDTRLPHVRLFASGSAPLAPEIFAAFQDLTGHQILERYGMTETGMNLSNPYSGPRLPGTVGRPLPGVSTRLVEGRGTEVEDGEEGELWVAGANVFGGYWRDPEKTAEAFAPDAAAAGRRWFRTGDLARRDPRSGHLTLLGRRHELILTGGLNVYPREVEEALETLPEVREAAVAGLPDRDRGERVAAWIVLQGDRIGGEDAVPEEPAALAAWLRDRLADRLADFKLPRRVFVVESLPRNALGKVQKHRLPGRAAG